MGHLWLATIRIYLESFNCRRTHLTESDAWVALSQSKRDIEGRRECIIEALKRLLEARTVRGEKRRKAVYWATEDYYSVSE